MAKTLNEREALDKIHEHVSRGEVGSFNDLKLWIYDNLPRMSVGGWSELRGILRAVYKLSDAEISKEFSSLRYDEEVDDFTPLVRDELDIKGFIRDGMELTSGLESPNAYGFWAWTTVLAAALERRCHVDMGFFKIWPALQTIIIGPSQRASKTTITDFIVDIVHESGTVNLLMDEGSQEGLKKQLQLLSDETGEACGLIYVPEMSTMFGEKDYNKDMVKSLTDLFDNRNWKSRVTITHGVQEIKNMAISSLMNSNERWLRESVPPSSFEGGWWARVLPIWCKGTDKVVPIPVLADRSLPERMKMGLKRAKLVKGVALLDEKASEYYIDRYKQMREQWPDDERLFPFWNKYPVHMLRLAMLLSISEDLSQRDDIKITYRNITQADRLLEWVMLRLPGLYNVLGTSEYGDTAMYVRQYIKQKGGRVSEAALGRHMLRKVPGYVLKKILQDMREYGMIISKPSRNIRGGADIILVNEED